MSEQSASISTTSRGGEGVKPLEALLGLVSFAAFVLVAYYFLTRPPALDRSILGLKGFVQFAEEQAKENGRSRFKFHDQYRAPDPAKTGLRILPLYDPNVFSQQAPSSSNKDDLTETLREIESAIVRNKIANIKTLIVLPKWRFGAQRLSRLHPDFLIDPTSHRLPFATSTALGIPEIRHGKVGFERLEPRLSQDEPELKLSLDHDLALYSPQTLSAETIGRKACTPKITMNGGTLLAHCRWYPSARPYWLLTDPDVLNNHGAANGDNFRFAYDLINALSEAGDIVVDGTVAELPRQTARRDDHQRSFADLMRFFQYPFSYVWVALLCLCALTLWHAGRRYGAVLGDDDGNTRLANKETIVDANVAIVRAVRGNEERLANRHVQQRLQVLANDILGVEGGLADERQRQLLAAIKRRNENLSSQLATSIGILSGAEGKASELFRNLNQFEKLINEVRHEFGRSASARR